MSILDPGRFILSVFDTSLECEDFCHDNPFMVAYSIEDHVFYLGKVFDDGDPEHRFVEIFSQPSHSTFRTRDFDLEAEWFYFHLTEVNFDA